MNVFFLYCISPDLQDVARQCSHMAHNTSLALQNHFLRNCETHALHIDATFRSFVRGDLSINDYCQKLKGFTNSLVNLNVDVTDRILMLNVLHGLNKHFEHLHAIFTHATPFPVVPEGARQSLHGVNPAENSRAAGHWLHPHRPLRHAEPLLSSSSTSG
jgi:hypothetical protein